MKRKVDWDKEEESDYEDTSTSEEESDDEEPRIKDVLEGLSQAVSRQQASDLLHSMAASKDILFWTPRGQLLRNQRIIPVTNISELVEYLLLPYNDDVAKPRALKTFIDRLAELGINKRLIKNKKILAELMEKERAYRDKDGEGSGDEEMVSDSNDVEGGRETENSDLEHEKNSEVECSEESASPEILRQGRGSCYHCNRENIYQTAVVKCPRCHWHDGYKI